MLHQANPRLIPLIEHDRAGLGGGLAVTGLLVLFCAWYSRPSRSFHQAMLLAGILGFGCAIGVHYVEGYTRAPAFAGALLFAIGLLCELTGTRRIQPAGPAAVA
jgi:dihydroorotate dehydrogenase